MSNFCQACGARLNPTARFCTGCGAAVDADPPALAAPQRSWALWLGGGAAALALIAGVAVATGKGLPFSAHSADTDGDGIVSESELRAEIAAMPPFELGQYQLTTEGRETGTERETRTRTVTVRSGDILDLVPGLSENPAGKERLYEDISKDCVVHEVLADSRNLRLNASCEDGPESGEAFLLGTRDSRSMKLTYTFTLRNGKTIEMNASAQKID